MLKKVSFKNYKAFEEGELEIRPITLLLGANSIGKSSILKFLLMLQQTALASEHHASALKLAGAIINLGPAKNIISKKKAYQIIEMSLEFEDENLNEHLKSGLLQQATAELSHYSWMLQSMSSQFQNQKSEKRRNKILHKGNEQIEELMGRGSARVDFELISDVLDLTANNFNLLKKSHSDSWDGLIARQFSQRFGAIGPSISETKLAFELLYSISNIVSTRSVFTFDFGLLERDNVFLIDTFRFSIDKRLVLEIKTNNLTNESSPDFQCPLLKITDKAITARIQTSLKNELKVQSTIFSFAGSKGSTSRPQEATNRSYLSEIILDVIRTSLSHLDDYFDERNITYVNPLRAYPKLYYFLDKAKPTAYLDTQDGDSMAEILKRNHNIKKSVNAWLKRFEVAVNVNELEDMLAKLSVIQNELDLDITQVGFGISQVLPVIIQTFLSLENSITLIEQPEIHLHPRMQADLADLFIEAVEKPGSTPTRYHKYVVIETHSEYLLKRLRRRISEGRISASDVALYLVSKNNVPGKDNSIIERIEIESKGSFKYPVEFYGGALLDDEIEFLKHQGGVKA